MSFGAIIKNTAGNVVIDDEHPTLELDTTATAQSTGMISNGFMYYVEITLSGTEQIMVQIASGDPILSIHRQGGLVRIWSPVNRTINYYIYEMATPTLTGTNPHGLIVRDSSGNLTFSSTSDLISIKHAIPQNNFGSVSTITTTGNITIPSSVNYFSFTSYPPQPVRVGPGTTFFIGSGIKRNSATTYEITNEIFGVLGIGMGGSSMYFGPTNGFAARVV